MFCALFYVAVLNPVQLQWNVSSWGNLCNVSTVTGYRVYISSDNWPISEVTTCLHSIFHNFYITSSYFCPLLECFSFLNIIVLLLACSCSHSSWKHVQFCGKIQKCKKLLVSINFLIDCYATSPSAPGLVYPTEGNYKNVNTFTFTWVEFSFLFHLQVRARLLGDFNVLTPRKFIR